MLKIFRYIVRAGKETIIKCIQKNWIGTGSLQACMEQGEFFFRYIYSGAVSARQSG